MQIFWKLATNLNFFSVYTVQCTKSYKGYANTFDDDQKVPLFNIKAFIIYCLAWKLLKLLCVLQGLGTIFVLEDR